MTEHHIPRKRFGQHFLHDKYVLDKIIQALNPRPNDFLVEIGPGQGALTTRVLNHVKQLTVIEIDRDLAAKLTDAYPKELTLYQADALRFNFAQLSNLPKTLRIFGNLPYNISTPILFHLIEFLPLIKDMVFMLQKEVVDRMAAPPSTSERGRLSVMVQYALEVSPLFDVSPNAFSPPPKVMSSVVHLKPYGENRLHPLAMDEKLFSQIVNSAFQHRRKTLKNALSHLVSPEIITEIIKSINLNPQSRPETLSVADFVSLSNEMTKLQNTDLNRIL